MSGRDTRLYPVCEIWTGESGAQWYEFAAAWISGIDGSSDKYCAARTK